MPSPVLSGETPFHIIFPHKSLFPIEPRTFGCTCFVQDVRPHVTKLDPKSLKCIFLGYSRVQKGYRCYCPNLNRCLVSADVTFMEHTPFASSSSSISTWKDDDLLIYTYTFPSSNLPSSTAAKPPITQGYSRRQQPTTPDPAPVPPPPASCPAPVPSSSDPGPSSSDDLPIALRKGKRQCTYPVSSLCHITIYHHHLVSLLHLLILSLFLRLFMMPYLILDGVMLWLRR